MPTLVVVYHSSHGHTKLQAEAVAQGAASIAGVTVSTMTCEEAPTRWETLHSADGIIFGCPTYMGSASAEFKLFMDATSSFWSAQKWKDKIAAGFSNSGGLSGDKFSTLMQLVTFAAQHSMIWVSQGVLEAPAEGSGGTEIDRIGSWLGSMAQSPSGKRKPDDSDLATARAFGARVARVALRWAAR